MKCSAAWIVIAGVAAAACSAKPDAVPKVTPSAEEILEANVTAMGGREAFAKREAVRINASFQIKKHGVSGTLTIIQKRPSLSYSSFSVAGAGREESGCDGTTCWEKSDSEGVRILRGEEHDKAVREAMFDSDVRWRELYTKVEALGPADFEGRPTWKVMLTPPTGSPETKYFDRKTRLEVGSEEIDRDQSGDAHIKIRTLEWETTDGITWPRRGLMVRDGIEIEMTINDVLLDPRIDKDQFDLPPEVKALLGGAAPAEAPRAQAETR